MASKYRLTDGSVMNVQTERQGPEYLEDLLDQVSRDRCCGVDCCNNRILLRDDETQEVMQIKIKNGVLVVEPKD